LRRNHKLIEKTEDKGHPLTGNCKIDLDLEKGEMLNFEYYNGKPYTTEILEVNIIIEKIK